jgi:hypothetical protein
MTLHAHAERKMYKRKAYTMNYLLDKQTNINYINAGTITTINTGNNITINHGSTPQYINWGQFTKINQGTIHHNK